MNNQTKIVFDEVSQYCERQLESYFGIVFGSVSAGRMSESSDIDLIVFADRYSTAQVDEITTLFLSRCELLKISTRAQIPHHLYLLTHYERLERAICLQGLELVSEIQGIVVPERIESPQFYTSDKMLLRFAFNAITTQHHLFCSSGNCYERYREAASLALLRLIVHLRRSDIFTIAGLIDSTIHEPFGWRREGRFLGYKDWDVIRSSLRDTYGAATRFLIDMSLLSQRREHYVVLPSKWWTDFDKDPVTGLTV